MPERSAPLAPAHTIGPRPGATSSPKRLLKRAPFALGAVAGLTLCALALLGALVVQGQHTTVPDATAQAICANLQSQNYGPIYDLMTPQLRAQGTQAQFVASQRRFDAARGTVATCRYVVEHSSAGSASVRFTLDRMGSAPSSGLVTLALLDHSWRIASYDADVI